MIDIIQNFFGENTPAQCVGLVGTALMFISYQQKTQKKIMLFQIFGITFFCVHFFMLDALTGCALNLLGVARAAVYYHRDKEWARSKLWIAAFCAAFVIAIAFTWEGWISLFPLAAMILSTFSLYITNTRLVRFLTFPCSPLWMTYNLIKGSAAGALTETLVMCSIIAAIIRYDILKKSENNK